ncbi:ATP-binding protein [Streptomyces sp. ISL-22]|uniref:ATP-binding protein n=1 Tax=unclassified Streptomyces TaxID=2593676 RepID=UPI001BEC7DDE|nr:MULTISPECIES: ATP-binding protein [unclassified Streptomyces]MBT2418979.1 ATP-binding protein [Streptomyces sp. ISL-24]MBT2437736.1 ATP-binding protein [Streptomyces sp. ISL-22]
MATESRGGGEPSSKKIEDWEVRFDGGFGDVTGARLSAEEFLKTLARAAPPATPEYRDDILLVVSELAANAIQYAPGPFRLTMRRTFEGVHVTLGDTSTTPPAPRPFKPGDGGGGGIGWYLIHTLCDQVSVVPREDGKDVHVFLPW